MRPPHTSFRSENPTKSLGLKELESSFLPRLRVILFTDTAFDFPAIAIRVKAAWENDTWRPLIAQFLPHVKDILSDQPGGGMPSQGKERWELQRNARTNDWEGLGEFQKSIWTNVEALQNAWTRDLEILNALEPFATEEKVSLRCYLPPLI
jgi:hypothetical protein